MKKQYQRLLEIASGAKQRAYAPYSQFRVGAALLATNGRIYEGCNIESSSFSLTICAERTALFKAISEGERNFAAIAIVSDDSEMTPPCGACRQVLHDLAGNIDVILADSRGHKRTLKLKTLIPHAFGSDNLRRRRPRRQ